jgi:hypothetical protein
MYCPNRQWYDETTSHTRSLLLRSRRESRQRRYCAAVLSVLAAAACSRDTQAGDEAAPATTAVAAPASAPGSELRALTGAHTRVVWVQGDGTDPDAGGDQLILMGFDSEDGRGERVILGDRRSRTMPRLTPRGDRIVFSSRIVPGPSEIFLVNFDGTGFRKLADGFAMALWQNPVDGTEWVYAGTDNKQWDFQTVTRFPIDDPARRELVWNSTMVSMEGFGVSPDGRLLGGQFPWPGNGVADVAAKTWSKLGEGCYTSLAFARGPLFWYFDGAHRNVTMVDVDAGTRWVVNLNNVPGFDGAEVSHPRWTNHPRFMTLTGPYNQGGPNQSRTGGKQTEVYVGRFSPDFAKIEAWGRVTNNEGGDSHPDVWIDGRSPVPRRPAGPIGPTEVQGAKAAGAAAGKADAGRPERLVLNVRLNRAGPIPDPQAILPYRHALVVNEYEVMDVVEGTYAPKQIRIAQWAIRDGKMLAEARRTANAASTLMAERYDAHPELEGERLISDSETSTLPLYYDVRRP